jgi:hypothetical protein
LPLKGSQEPISRAGDPLPQELGGEAALTWPMQPELVAGI